MKTKSFFLIIVFALSLSSYGETSVDEKPADQLYAMGGRRVYDGSEEIILPWEFVYTWDDLIFTGDDIISFNPATREIVFADSISAKYECFTWYDLLTIYFNDKPLLEKIATRTHASSFMVNDLVLLCEFKYKYYLNNGYPEIADTWPEETKERMQKEREENAEKRKAGWDIFMQYLSDAGKIVGDTGINDVKTAQPIQIYSAGKTIYVDNPIGKEAVITVYGIGGVKIAEQKMMSQTTTVEMPVSGFYLVSVKAENEKPVTAKLIVK
jgi:hypothetical protein